MTVKGGSVQKGVILLDAELSGKRVQLECFMSEPDCKIPKTGRYVFTKAPAGKGPYMDCSNISLYQKSTSTVPITKIADYCLLSDGF
jgi:hypothetical protein